MIRLFIAALAVSGLIGFETDSTIQYEQLSSPCDPEKEVNTLMANDSLIVWSASRKLTWDDFQGTPIMSNDYKAITSVLVKYEHKLSETQIDYYVNCCFFKKTSWSKEKKSGSLLTHEQLHFDIAEFITRKIRKDLSNHVSKNLNTTSQYLKEINDKYYHYELDSLNKLYDSETDHGTIASKQKEWELKISKELKALNAYSSTRVTIKR